MCIVLDVLHLGNMLQYLKFLHLIKEKVNILQLRKPENTFWNHFLLITDYK